jgi:hypothetical protein
MTAGWASSGWTGMGATVAGVGCGSCAAAGLTTMMLYSSTATINVKRETDFMQASLSVLSVL